MTALIRWFLGSRETGPPACNLPPQYCPEGLDGPLVTLGLIALSLALAQLLASVYFHICATRQHQVGPRERLRARIAYGWFASSCVLLGYYHTGLIADAIGAQLFGVSLVIIVRRVL